LAYLAVAHAWVRWRASAVLWAAHARRIARAHPSLPSLLLVVLGMGGGLAGGALVGEWCLGLVMMAESAALIWVGWNRDDGQGAPDEHTLAAILDRARSAP
jgi:hypothetical protein